MNAAIVADKMATQNGQYNGADSYMIINPIERPEESSDNWAVKQMIYF